MASTAFDHQTVPWVFQHRARHDGNRIFLTFHDPGHPEAGRSLTYADCADEVALVQDELRRHGLQEGDRILLHMSNSPDLVVAMLAVLELGAVAVPTDADATWDELAHIVAHSEPSAIISDDVSFPAAERLALRLERPLPVICGRASTPHRHRQVSTKPTPHRPDAPAGHRIAMLLYTSGTTGRSKGVLLSHAALVAAATATRDEIAQTPADCSYCVLPLAHVNTICHQLVATLLTGSRLAISPRFDVEHYWKAAVHVGATIGNLTAEHMRALLAAHSPPQQTNNDMRMMMATMPMRWDETYAVQSRSALSVSAAWGLTETAGAVTRSPRFLDPDPGWGSVGTVLPGWELRVVDEAGVDLPDGETGELLVRGPGVMDGYFDAPDATAEALTTDGWLHTGDLGWVGEKGYVHVLGRHSDLMTVQGDTCAAGEVEAVLHGHRRVRDCAAVSVSLGEGSRATFVVAYIVPDPNKAIDDTTLRQYCASQLPASRVPATIIRVTSLPRSLVGDIRRALLRRRAPFHLNSERPLNSG